MKRFLETYFVLCFFGFVIGTQNIYANNDKNIKAKMNNSSLMKNQNIEKERINSPKNQDLENDVSPRKDTPKLWVLSIGVSKFKHGFTPIKDGDILPKGKIPNLDYADNDAMTISCLLADRGDQLFDSVNIKTLINEEATKENILNGFTKFLKHAGRDDLIIIFMSGHGKKSGEHYYFLTYDTDPNNLDVLGFRDDKLEEYIANLQKDENAKKMVLIVDTCFSGLLEKISKDKFYLFASSNEDESSQERVKKCVPGESRGHGALTCTLIKASFKEDVKDQQEVLTLEEWFNYSANILPDLVKGEHRPVERPLKIIKQEPIIKIIKVRKDYSEEDAISKIISKCENGYITVNAIPWGNIFIDGNPLGMTPLVRYQISAGQHLLEIKRDNYNTYQENLEVKLGDLIIKSPKLIETTSPNHLERKKKK